MTTRTPPPTRSTPDLRRATAGVTHVFELIAALVALVLGMVGVALELAVGAPAVHGVTSVI